MDKEIAAFLLQVLATRTISCGEPTFWETANMVKGALDALTAIVDGDEE